MAQGSQPNHHVTNSANYTKSTSNADKLKKAAIIAATVVAAKNPVLRAGKAIVTATKTAEAARKATEKTVSKNAVKAEEIAKNSVKVKPANKSNPTNEKLNFSENMRVRDMKSGDYAKRNIRLEEKRNSLHNQFFGKSKTIKIKGD